MFEDDVKNIVDKYGSIFGEVFDLRTIKGEVKGKIVPRPKNQYSNILWYKWKIKNTFDKKNLKEEYRNKITGIHIMPYRINSEDVYNAVLKSPDKVGRNITEDFKLKNKAENKFDQIDFKKNPGYVDYDPISANFHKQPSMNYQIVLIQGPGPGWQENKIGYIKSGWYFPNINACDENSDNDSRGIKELLLDVLKEILVDQAYQKIKSSL